jgi:peptidoglycan/xylan/chitin deacetylase (PgdA/CDA1 family)
LTLAEGLQRLYEGTLPERSVVLTVDDGTYDSYKIAFPMFREFGYPATLYFTTYYAGFQRPVFDVMCSYLLWKAAGKTFDGVLLNEAGRGVALEKIKSYAIKQGLSGLEKDALMASMADRLGIDYEDLCRRRILHCMTRDEAQQLARHGFDIELHTHRHRVSRRREQFLKEIKDNEQCIGLIRDGPARHFCYPGGVYLPEVEEALRSYGIESAVTCSPGIAEARSAALRLPRLIDTNSLSLDEFAGWVSGVASFLPMRAFTVSDGQIVE